MKLLLLNGPPRCGKDTVVRELIPYIKFRHMKFIMPAKRAFAALLDITESQLENFKDVSNPVLQRTGTTTKDGRDTIREGLIKFSDDFFRKVYGEDVFGRIFWAHARNSAEELIIASDCGKQDEVERVISSAGKNNCLLVRIHRDGCSFEGDSRSFLRDGLCNTWDIDNNQSVHMFTMKVLRLITRELGFKLLKEPDWTKDIG